MVRRIVTLIVSCGLVLGFGLLPSASTFGQDPAKKGETPAKPEPPKTEPAKDKDKKDEKKEEKKAEPPKATEAPLPPIPKEVQAKIDAARRAVAEAIVAAQDAGLVETSIDPPPILDILVTGRATDARTLKNATAKKPYGVHPEVFAAWFTGYGASAFDSIDYVKDVRIVRPSEGLKSFFDQRAAILRNEIAEVRKAHPAPKPAETKKEAPKAEPKKDEPKKEAPKAADTKKEEPKKSAEPKK